MYGAWDTLKNMDKLYPNHRLAWAAFIAGKRESRRLLGDVLLTGDDFRQGRVFEDGCFPCTWHIDLHMPHPDFAGGHGIDAFISKCTTGREYSYKRPYWAPYRCLYSRTISNLFMAGRDISVTHEALGPVRVQKTCGMMGEVVGKAAWICIRHQTLPRGVYQQHLALLKELMAERGVMRRETLDGVLALPPGVKLTTYYARGLDPALLPGLVIDDAQAELTGTWSDHGRRKGFIGEGYLYSSDPGASARFPFTVKKTGLYEVRTTWLPQANHARTLCATVSGAGDEKSVTLDQSVRSEGERGFQTLGTFRFEAGKPCAVRFAVKGAHGTVHIDAVQIVPVLDIHALMAPVPQTARFSDDRYYIWGASMVRDKTGMCYLQDMR